MKICMKIAANQHGEPCLNLKTMIESREKHYETSVTEVIIMRLSYYALFPDQAESPVYHTIKLNKRNAYSLPEGEYNIYDHYPTQMREEPAVYLSIEAVSSRQHLATLQIQLPPVVGKATIRVSPEYLQSSEAPKVLSMLEKQILKDRNHVEALSQRLLAVAQSNLQLLLPQTLMARGVLSQLGDYIGQMLEETSVKKRQGMLEGMLKEMGKGLLEGIDAASTHMYRPVSAAKSSDKPAAKAPAKPAEKAPAKPAAKAPAKPAAKAPAKPAAKAPAKPAAKAPAKPAAKAPAKPAAKAPAKPAAKAPAKPAAKAPAKPAAKAPAKPAAKAPKKAK
jgi:hypothetical protein